MKNFSTKQTKFAAQDFMEAVSNPAENGDRRRTFVRPPPSILQGGQLPSMPAVVPKRKPKRPRMKDGRSTEPARNNGAGRRIPGMEFGPGGLPPSASEGDLVGRVKFRSKAEVYVRDETMIESSASLKKLQARSDLMSAHVLLDGERMADYDDEATVATGVTLESRYQGESGLFSNKQIRNQVRSPHSPPPALLLPSTNQITNYV